MGKEIIRTDRVGGGVGGEYCDWKGFEYGDGYCWERDYGDCLWSSGKLVNQPPLSP